MLVASHLNLQMMMVGNQRQSVLQMEVGHVGFWVVRLNITCNAVANV